MAGSEFFIGRCIDLPRSYGDQIDGHIQCYSNEPTLLMDAVVGCSLKRDRNISSVSFHCPSIHPSSTSLHTAMVSFKSDQRTYDDTNGVAFGGPEDGELTKMFPKVLKDVVRPLANVY